MATTVNSRRETVSLIGSDKLESTPVYGADDRKIGTVQRVMIDKISGKVAYAVISFGGFLGMGEDYYPMPWASLKYDTSVGGYRVGVTEDQLKGAPKYNRNTESDCLTAAGTRRSTITIVHRCGTPDVIRRLGECRPALLGARRLAAITTNALSGLFCGGVRTTSDVWLIRARGKSCRSDRAARRDEDCPRLWHGRAAASRD